MHTYTCPHDLSQDEAVVAGRLDYGRAMRRVFRLTNMTAGAHTKCILANVCMYVCIVGVCLVCMCMLFCSRPSVCVCNMHARCMCVCTVVCKVCVTYIYEIHISITFVCMYCMYVCMYVLQPGQEEVCVFAENVVGFIRTPTFALQVRSPYWLFSIGM